MRHVIRLAAACMTLVALGFLFDGALAKTVKLSGTYSAGQLKDKCGASGGDFVQTDAGYGCTGPGGQVNCTTKGKCTGTCPKCGTSQARNSGIGGIVSPNRGNMAPTSSSGGSKGKNGLSPVSVGGGKGTGGMRDTGGIKQTGGIKETGGSNRPGNMERSGAGKH